MKALKWLVSTKLGWLIISFLWIGTFMIIDDNIESNWAFYVALPGFAYIIILFLIMIAYAWVINPWKENVENKRLRDEASKKV
jgi:apolipoprotein N-acyltransferase